MEVINEGCDGWLRIISNPMTVSATILLSACGGGGGVSSPGSGAPRADMPVATPPVTSALMLSPAPRSAENAPAYEASGAIASTEAVRALVEGAPITESAKVELAPHGPARDFEPCWLAARSPISTVRFGALDAGHVARAGDVAGFVTLVMR